MPMELADTSHARRVAIASAVGTIIEFYEFSVYATAAVLVFSQSFFPALGGLQGGIVALATFGVAFVVRPLGAVIFGYLGDRRGRKNTLVWSLVIMGVATIGIGLLPTAATIGVAAPILLVALRIIQGLALGGEWAGASLMTAESSPTGERGKYGIGPQLGPAIGFILSSLTFLAVSATLSPEQFIAWGWRIPFLASAVLIVIGLVIRVRLDESPVFVSGAKVIEKTSRIPMSELFSRQLRVLLLASGGSIAVFALFYVVVAFLPAYGTNTLGFSQSAVLIVNIAGAVVGAVTLSITAVLSDRLGRKPVLLAANVLCLVAALLFFPIISAGHIASYAVGVFFLQAAVGAAYGPLAAYLPELFATQYRYTGAGLAYNIATVLGASLTPIIATILISNYGVWTVTVYLAAICLITLACLAASGETARTGLVTSPAAEPVSTNPTFLKTP
ncbi:MFS transporter [Rhodococcus opacus]|uniref:MFS transporter n=1 Tax=Rhodococcus opacus TaxID=37919 RepID=UPI00211DE3E0|nr:MFS transporter [Rhodococcus opacus]